MTDYAERKLDMKEAITLELAALELEQLHKVSKYIHTLQTEQKPLFTDDVKCLVCGRILIKPRRGPMPKFCGDKCRQRNHRSLNLSRVNK